MVLCMSTLRFFNKHIYISFQYYLLIYCYNYLSIFITYLLTTSFARPIAWMNEFTSLHIFSQFESFRTCALISLQLFFFPFATLDLETLVRTAAVVIFIAWMDFLASFCVFPEFESFLTFAYGVRSFPDASMLTSTVEFVAWVN